MARKKGAKPIECPLCRSETRNVVAIEAPQPASANELTDVRRIISTCAGAPEALKPAHDLAALGYSLQTCILALLRSLADASAARVWLQEHCFTHLTEDQLISAASEVPNKKPQKKANVLLIGLCRRPRSKSFRHQTVSNRRQPSWQHAKVREASVPCVHTRASCCTERYNVREYASWDEFRKANGVSSATAGRNVLDEQYFEKGEQRAAARRHSLLKTPCSCAQR